MTHATLFSGIGGPELAAEWVGWENIFHCEWNPFGKEILNYYWPNSKSYEDITKTDFTIHRGQIDVLTGGFPCQPYSVAGKQKGKEDERHLWPEMLRAIREIKPVYIVGENVGGLVSWNGGMVFDEVQAQMEDEGYEVFPCVLPAASVNAPHKRDRIFFIAYHNNRDREKNRLQARRKKYVYQTEGRTDASNPACQRCNDGRNNRKERQIHNHSNRNAAKDKSKGNRWECRSCKVGQVGNVTNTTSTRRREDHWLRESRQLDKKSQINNWEEFPTQSPICDGNDGISARLDLETILEARAKKANKAFNPFNWWRKESIKAGGNAIVPQVIFQIYKAIDQHYADM